MNISTLKIALSAAQNTYDQFKKYRDEKALETYERLSTAAESLGGMEGIRERGGELIEESRREAGQVTKAARARLEKALHDAQERGQEVSSGARKVSRKTQKKADRQAGRLKARARGKAAPGNRRFTLIALILLLLTTIGGAAFWFLRKNKETPGTEVPEIREYALKEGSEQPESTLVYSTETPADEEPATGKLMSEEELLASLDDQLAKHRLEEDDEPAEGEDTQDASQAAAEAAGEPAEEVEEVAEVAEVEAPAETTETAEDIQAEFDRKNARQREQGEKK